MCVRMGGKGRNSNQQVKMKKMNKYARLPEHNYLINLSLEAVTLILNQWQVRVTMSQIGENFTDFSMNFHWLTTEIPYTDLTNWHTSHRFKFKEVIVIFNPILSIHRVPPPMSFLLGCDRGKKTKPKIILAKFYPSLSLGRIRFQRFA